MAERTTYEFLNTGSVAGRAVGQAVLLPRHIRGLDPVTVMVVIVAENPKTHQFHNYFWIFFNSVFYVFCFKLFS